MFLFVIALLVSAVSAQRTFFFTNAILLNKNIHPCRYPFTLYAKTPNNAAGKSGKATPINPKDNEANISNPNKGTAGTNKQYDQNQGNRGKQLNPNQKK